MRGAGPRPWSDGGNGAPTPLSSGGAQNSMSSSSISSGSSFAAAIHSRISGIARTARRRRALLVELHVVGHEARDHRRVHRVGHRALAEQIRPAVVREASRQIAVMRSMSPCARAHTLWPGKRALEVHRQRGAQAGEARVHLAADRAAVRARRRGPTGSRPAFGLDSFRYSAIASVSHTLIAVVREARHQDRRRQQQDLLARVGVVGRDIDLLELEPRELREQPPAQ